MAVACPELLARHGDDTVFAIADEDRLARRPDQDLASLELVDLDLVAETPHHSEREELPHGHREDEAPVVKELNLAVLKLLEVEGLQEAAGSQWVGRAAKGSGSVPGPRCRRDSSLGSRCSCL